MTNSQEVSREVAIFAAVVANERELKGETFVTARRKLLNFILRPADIHLVEKDARTLYNAGLLKLEGGHLRLDVVRVRERLEGLARRLDHPSYKDMDPELKAQIRDLAEQLHNLGRLTLV